MLFFVSTSQEVSLNVNNFEIKNSNCKKRLRIKFDSKLDQHITDSCKTASRKIHRKIQNLQVLATEMYKISNGLPKPLVEYIFPINRNCYIL